MDDVNLNRVYAIVTEADDDLKKDISILDESARNMFLDYMIACKEIAEAVKNQLKREEEKKEKLSLEEAKKLQSMYEKFISQSDDYLSNTLYIHPTMSKYITALNTAMVPIKEAYQELTQRIEKNQEEISLSEVVDSNAWISKLIYKDPEVAQVKEIEHTENYNLDAHTIEENLNRYGEGMKKVWDGYRKHMAVLMGEVEPNDIQLETGIHQFTKKRFKNALFMMQEALNQDYAPDECDIDVMAIYQVYEKAEKIFDIQSVSTLGFHNVVWDRVCDFVLGQQFDHEGYNRVIDKGVEKGKLSEEKAKFYKAAIKNINITPPNLRIDENELVTMSRIAAMLTLPHSVQEQLIQNDKSGLDIHDNKHPLKYILDKGKIIQDKSLAYLKGLPGATAPTYDDYDIYFDALGDYINRAPLFNDKEMTDKNENLEYCYTACESIAKHLPTRYAARFNQVKEVITARMDEAIKDQMQVLATDDFSAIDPKDPNKGFKSGIAWQKTLKIYQTRHASDELMQKAYFIRMFRDEQFRKREVEDAKKLLTNIITDKTHGRVPGNEAFSEFHNDKIKFQNIAMTVILGKMAEREINSIFAVNDADAGSRRDRLSVGCNYDIANIFDSRHPMTAEEMEKAFDYFQRLMASDRVKNFMQYPLDENMNYSHITKEQKEALAANAQVVLDLSDYTDNMVEIALVGGGERFLETISDRAMDALTQPYGKKNDNSPSYEAIFNAMNKLTSATHNPEGIRSEDYVELYRAGVNYLNLHETKLSGENGQLRVEAARELVAKLGAKLEKELPDMKPEIEKDRQLQMLRCKEYRQMAIKEASDIITEIAGPEGMMSRIDYNHLPVQSQEKLNDAIKTFAFGMKAQEMLMKDKQADRIKGVIKNPEAASKLLQKYSAATDIADRALDEKYFDIMKIHGKYVESINPQIKEKRELASEEKEARMEILEGALEEAREEMKLALSSKDDAKILESTAMVVYLSRVKKNAPIMSAEGLKNALHRDCEANVERIKPFAAHVISEMPSGIYQREASEGKLGEYIDERMKPLMKHENKYQEEYRAALEANDGVFKRKEDVALKAMV